MASELSGGVQSVERSYVLLELIAEAGGEISLSKLAAASGLPTATVHRLAQTLAAGGYVRHLASRRYALGPRLIQLGEASSRFLGSLGGPNLARLAEKTGESANMAIFDRDGVVYVAQAPSRHSMRMFTEVGRRVEAHCTGVGKVLLAQMRPEVARATVVRTGMQAHTKHTITDPDKLEQELAEIRKNGYAVDNEEKELGVRCVAVSVPADSMTAISVSGPTGRVTLESIASIAGTLHEEAELLARELRAD
jgi:IclR family acetate operon transcriptional repressor